MPRLGNTGHRPNDRITRPSRQISLGANMLPDDEFFDQLMRCQASRLEDQRTTFPVLFSSSNRVAREGSTQTSQSLLNSSSGVSLSRSDSNPSRGSQNPDESNKTTPNTTNTSSPRSGSTLPDEDFFSLIMRFQSARIEDQRSSFPCLNRNRTDQQSSPSQPPSSQPASSAATAPNAVNEVGTIVDCNNRKKCSQV